MSRPFILDPLFRNITTLPGVGPKNAKLMSKLLSSEKVLHLLWHNPVDFIDRRFSCKIEDAPADKVCTMQVKVIQHFVPKRRGQPHKVKCKDDTGTITLVFFHAHKDWLFNQLPESQDVIISGKVEYYQGNTQMVHPDSIGTLEERSLIEKCEPIYPLTQGLSNKVLGKAIQGALGFLPKVPEWLDPALKKQNKWLDWHKCIEAMHSLEDSEVLDTTSRIRQRLAYDELLANQLALAMVRFYQRRISGRVYSPSHTLRAQVMEALPFSLTNAQIKALEEIDSDMATKARMMRLLQGDVGSGKTIIACLAMLNAVESGAQAAIMAPTEILARQHYDTLKPWLDRAGVRFVVLTGRDKGKTRETLLSQIKNGAAQLIIGTHAVFQDDVIFKDLGMVVIDEQHRFGVHQRLKISSKGQGVDVLVMTATPIPRTLTLTSYGDMDVSRLDEKPPGRKPIDTRLISQENLESMIEGLHRKIEEGARIYWVCPLVEESEKLDLAAAEERFDILHARFGDKVGLVHGRLKPAEKDAVMEKFIQGKHSILVATTVIEVGVNVPEATIMVIEHAERFGLAQLHQLRGRVGRGSAQSYCFLLYASSIGETAKQRLKMMRESEDGFLIAEKDLELRGGGDILGTKQSGYPEFNLAELPAHTSLLSMARDEARYLIEKDPELKGDRSEAIRALLYLFERDQAIQYLQSG